MKIKNVKVGAKIHHVDFEDEIGIISFVNSHYFEIDYPNKPKSILMNPYQAGWDETRDFKLVKDENKKD